IPSREWAPDNKSASARSKSSEGDPAMRTRFLPIIVVLVFAGATLAATGCDDRAQKTDVAVVRVSAPADAAPERRGGKVYDGRLKDVRPAWGVLVLTVGKGKEAQDLRLAMSAPPIP